MEHGSRLQVASHIFTNTHIFHINRKDLTTHQVKAPEALHEFTLLIFESVSLVDDAAPPGYLREQFYILYYNLVCCDKSVKLKHIESASRLLILVEHVIFLYHHSTCGAKNVRILHHEKRAKSKIYAKYMLVFKIVESLVILS